MTHALAAAAPATAPAVDGLPLTVALAGREVLVVGAGPVSARRARAFVEAGARVTCVAPRVGEAMSELATASAGAVTVLRREFETTDLDTPWLVHAATGVPEVDAEIAAACDSRRLWCVTAGDASVGTARVPARTAVTTPAGAVRIAVDSGDPRRSVRVGRHVARSLATAPAGLRARRRAETGWVAVVGGDGERDLLTVRGQRLVHAADVLVVDGGLDPALRLELDDDVEVLELRGELDRARAGRLVAARHAAGLGVVRIVTARGLAREADAMREAGLEPELVPGVPGPA